MWIPNQVGNANGQKLLDLHYLIKPVIKCIMKKRVFDIIFSSAALVVAAVPMAALYVATKVKMGGDAIFKQQRLGKDGVPFTVYKFRSMKNEFDDKGNPLPDADRVTKFGKFMRSRGIDELPQLFNILKGDMSVVGPRPKSYPPLNGYAKIVEKHPEILGVNPGLVCSVKVAEIARREKLPFDEHVALDVKDATDPWSLCRDFNLIVGVIPALRGSNPHEYKENPKHYETLDQ